MSQTLLLFGCSVCFGDPASPLTKGAISGILLLLGVIVTVLTLIISTAFLWVRRARRINPDGHF